MIKKLIVVAMLIATLGLGSLAYAQGTTGSSGNKRTAGNRKSQMEKTPVGKRHYRRVHRHRRHKRGGWGGHLRDSRKNGQERPRPKG
jgi:hypothetical protein